MDKDVNNINLVDAAGFSRYPHTVTGVPGKEGLPISDTPDQNEVLSIPKPTVKRNVSVNATVSPLADVENLNVNTSFKDPVSRTLNSKVQLPEIINKIRKDSAKTYYSKQSAYSSLINADRSRNSIKGLSPYGDRVSAEQVYDIYKDGTMLPKYDSFSLGRRNEEYNARNQSNWDKTVNAAGKLATKTALYGVGGVVGAVYGIGSAIRDLSFASLFDNEFNDQLNMIDERINHQFAHYYTEEEKNMNLLQKMGTFNFWANDIVGSGMSFTFGAILSAYITGGLGLATLGSAGARVGMRIAANMGRFGRAAVATKSTLGALRRGAMAGKAIGNVMKTTGQLFTGAAWEASVEANSYLRESEDRYKDYILSTTGRQATSEELAEFKAENIDAANSVFAANMGIVGLSNYLLLGKYLGIGSGLVGRYFKRKVGDVTRGVDRYLFGLGTKRSLTDPGKLVAIEANKLQKTIGTTWNVIKRPLSEGLFEEGLQGVTQKAASEYMESKYDKTKLQRTAGVVDAIINALVEQYTSKEGWVEIGAGAIIGGLFGIREGFGIRERVNKAKSISRYVEEYNKNEAFMPESVKNTINTMASLSSQISFSDNESLGYFEDSNASASEYQKFALSDSLGTLDSYAEDFESMIESLDDAELASSIGVDASKIKGYKDAVISDFRRKLNNYRDSVSFADAIVGDLTISDFKDFLGQTIYRGVESVDKVKFTSRAIQEIINSDLNISSGLFSLSFLPNEVMNKAMEIDGLKTKIEELNKEIESYALSPKRIDSNGVDTEAERIKAKTKELNDLQQQYRDMLSMLRYRVYDTGIFNVGDNVGDLLEMELTPDRVLEAYDSMKALETYLSTIDEKSMNNTDRLLVQLVNEYKDNVVYLRSVSSLINNLGDKRFLSDYYKGFTKIASKFFEDGSKSLATERDVLSAGSRFLTDEQIDELVNKGKLTEGQAYTYKVLSHMGDGISELEVDNEIISDIDYERLKDPNSSGPELLDIASAIYAGNEDILTPRQKEIYEIHKDFIDARVQELGGSLTKALIDLSTKLDEAVRGNTDATDMLPDGVKNTLDGLLKDYYIDKTDGSKERLEEFIEDYARENGAASKLLIDSYRVSWLKDNGLYNGASSVVADIEGSMAVRTSIGGEDVDIASDLVRGKSVACANPVMVVCKIVGRSRSNVQFSNLDLESFFTSLGIASYEKVSGGKISQYKLKFGDGTEYILHVNEIVPGRFVIPLNELDVLKSKTNIVIPTGLSSSYSMVYKSSPDGSVVPFYTGIGYGETGTDVIDEEAVGEAQVGDKVSMEIGINDAYNQKLWSEYKDALARGENADEAKNDLLNNIVVKILDSKGRFISVLALRNTSDFRQSTLDEIEKAFSDKVDVLPIGDAVISGKMPGRVNTKRDITGAPIVSPIQFGDTSNITNVGYIQDGKYYLKEAGDFVLYPYATELIRSSKRGPYKGQRFPVVVVKGKDGKNYVYPVSLQNTDSTRKDALKSSIEDFLTDPDSYSNEQFLSLASEINSYIREMELDYDKYSVNPVGTWADAIESIRNFSDALNGMPSVNVAEWVRGDRSVVDIVVSDVASDIDFDNTFVGPKIWIGRSKDASEVTPETGIELPFPEPGSSSTTSTTGASTGAAETSTRAAETTGTSTETTETPTETTGLPAESTGTQAETGTAAPAETTTEPETTSGKTRTSSKKGFSNRLIELDGVSYKNIIDFLCRSIASGELVFFVDRKKKAKDVRYILDDYGIKSSKFKSYANENGKTLEEIVDWLESQDSDVVKSYLATKPQDGDALLESVRNDLRFLLNVVPNATAALNYSLSVNGKPTISENAQNVDIRSIVDKIDGFMLSDVGSEELANNITDVIESAIDNDLTRLDEAISILSDKLGISLGRARKIIEDSLNTIKGEQGENPEVERAAEELKKKEEAERKAKEEAERKAKEEAERKAKEEAERKAKEDAERKAKEEAERKAKEEAERKAREEAEREAKKQSEIQKGDIKDGTEGKGEIKGSDSTQRGQGVSREGSGISATEGRGDSRGTSSIGGLVNSENGESVKPKKKLSLISVSSSDIKNERIENNQPEINSTEWLPGIEREPSFKLTSPNAGPFVYSGRFNGVRGGLNFRPLTEAEVRRDSILGKSVGELRNSTPRFTEVGSWVYAFDISTGYYHFYNLDTSEAFAVNNISFTDLSSLKFWNSLSQTSRDEAQNNGESSTGKKKSFADRLSGIRAKKEALKKKLKARKKNDEVPIINTKEEEAALLNQFEEMDISWWKVKYKAVSAYNLLKSKNNIPAAKKAMLEKYAKNIALLSSIFRLLSMSADNFSFVEKHLGYYYQLLDNKVNEFNEFYEELVQDGFIKDSDTPVLTAKEFNDFLDGIVAEVDGEPGVGKTVYYAASALNGLSNSIYKELSSEQKDKYFGIYSGIDDGFDFISLVRNYDLVKRALRENLSVGELIVDTTRVDDAYTGPAKAFMDNFVEMYKAIEDFFDENGIVSMLGIYRHYKAIVDSGAVDKSYLSKIKEWTYESQAKHIQEKFNQLKRLSIENRNAKNIEEFLDYAYNNRAVLGFVGDTFSNKEVLSSKLYFDITYEYTLGNAASRVPGLSDREIIAFLRRYKGGDWVKSMNRYDAGDAGASKAIFELYKAEFDKRDIPITILNMREGLYTIDSIRELFDILNVDKTTSKLFDRISGVLNKMDLKIAFFNDINTDRGGFASGNRVAYSKDLFDSEYLPDYIKADVLLHELIHAATVAIINKVNDPGRSSVIQRDYELTQDMIDAVNELNSIYELLRKDELFTGEYGITNVREMVAELSNLDFRNKLKEKNLWVRIVNAIKKLFGIETKGKKSTALNEIGDAVERILSGFEQVLDAGGPVYNQSVRSSTPEFDTWLKEVVDSEVQPYQKTDINRMVGRRSGNVQRRLAAQPETVYTGRRLVVPENVSAKAKSSAESILGEGSFVEEPEGLTFRINGNYVSFKTGFYSTPNGLAELNVRLSDLKNMHSANIDIKNGRFNSANVKRSFSESQIEDMKSHKDRYVNRAARDLVMEKIMEKVLIPYMQNVNYVSDIFGTDSFNFDVSLSSTTDLSSLTQEESDMNMPGFSNMFESASGVTETGYMNTVSPRKQNIGNNPKVNISHIDFSEANSEIFKNCVI